MKIILDGVDCDENISAGTAFGLLQDLYSIGRKGIDVEAIAFIRVDDGNVKMQVIKAEEQDAPKKRCEKCGCEH